MTEDFAADLQSWSAFAAGFRAKIVQGSIWIEPPGNDIPLDLQVVLHDLDPARERERERGYMKNFMNGFHYIY